MNVKISIRSVETTIKVYELPLKSIIVEVL